MLYDYGFLKWFSYWGIYNKIFENKYFYTNCVGKSYRIDNVFIQRVMENTIISEPNMRTTKENKYYITGPNNFLQRLLWAQRKSAANKDFLFDILGYLSFFFPWFFFVGSERIRLKSFRTIFPKNCFTSKFRMINVCCHISAGLHIFSNTNKSYLFTRYF